MLKVRIIPTLLLRGFGLVKGKSFNSWRRVGPVLPAIKVYNHRDVDELVILDTEASLKNDEIDYESIEDFSPDCFIPLTIGGGIKNIDQVQKLLHLGADKISINSASYECPELITKIASLHGSQSIVSSVDVRKVDKDKWLCFSHSGTKSTSKEVIQWVREIEDRGAGEILLTSIDFDGTLKGYDLKLIEEVVSNVDIPVIASGGAGSYQHMVDAINLAGASAVAAASIFHFTERTPAEAKKYLSERGIAIRSNYRK